MRVNYTTYDIRRDQLEDSLNPRTQADMVLLSQRDDGNAAEFAHPCWYVCIIGIFYVYATRAGDDFYEQRVDFLWILWLGRDMRHKSGFKTRRLPRIGFVPSNDPDAFGFLNPRDVVWATHLIPPSNHDAHEPC